MNGPFSRDGRAEEVLVLLVDITDEQTPPLLGFQGVASICLT